MLPTPEVARALRNWLSERQDAMLALLIELAQAESPSDDAAAQAGPQAILERELTELGFAVTRQAGRQTGGCLLAQRPSADADRPHQLLIGHSDTVWPLGTLHNMPIHVADGRLYGPGVFDMKGGLVQMLYALRALRALGLAPTAEPIVLINSDEEISSIASRDLIAETARGVARALVFEPALGPTGKLKTRRKGVARYDIAIAGRAAHAGLDPERGVSAVLELAHVIQACFALNDAAAGVSVNVGMVEGGVRSNIIAPSARAVVEVRADTQAAMATAEAALRGLQPRLPGAQVCVGAPIGRPPLEATPANRALWETARAVGRLMDLELEEGSAGGGSDGNFTSAYTATLDGLGPVGDGAHAAHEHVVIAGLAERSALAAALMLVAP